MSAGSDGRSPPTTCTAADARAAAMYDSTLSRCSALMSGPTITSGSNGSPTFIASTRGPSRDDELVVDAALHEDPGAVRAHLAGGEEVGEQRRRHRRLEIGVVEHDQRRLAAELERDVLERRCGIGHHDLAGRRLARERDLGDPAMAGEHLTDPGVALHDVEHAVGERRPRCRSRRGAAPTAA